MVTQNFRMAPAILAAVLTALSLAACDDSGSLVSNNDSNNNNDSIIPPAERRTGHPYPQPIDGTPDNPAPDWTLEMADGGKTSIYQTPSAVFPEKNPFETSEPSNLLPTIYEPLRDSGGDIIPNTLPSTPEHPYNLHPDPQVSEIDPRSPRWDLNRVIAELKTAVDTDYGQAVNQTLFRNGEGVPADPRRGGIDSPRGQNVGLIENAANQRIDYDRVQFAIDILEGNPVDRSYSGIALLHYQGPDNVKTVNPATNTVTVHQSWQHARIMSDTMFVDPSTIPDDETWTIRYIADSLHWGEEDFAPFATFFDDPRDIGISRANFGMDQSFFPMKPGHRYVFEIAMPPHRFWNLTYNWGWRVHSPRIQAIEKATKKPGGKNIVKWESDVFGENPGGSRQAQLEAIAMLSNLAPAKRMWFALRAIKMTQNGEVPQSLLPDLVAEVEAAFDDWNHRLRLPRGLDYVDGYDETIVYLNNMMYGGIRGLRGTTEPIFPKWQTRGATLKVKLLNGDYFPHFYMNVDFGGRRGWENIYQNTIPLGGQGPLFTFGRAYFFPNLKSPAQTPAAVPGTVVPLGNTGINLAQYGGHTQPRAMHAIAAPALRQAILAEASKPGTASRRVVSVSKQLNDVALSDASRTTDAARKAMRAVDDPIKTQMGMRLADRVTTLARNPAGLGEHNVIIHYRYEPSRRLRFYQFDPMHHNEDIISVH